MIMMCGPTWNSLPLPVACDLLGTHLSPCVYEIPTLCTLGVRPAKLSLKNFRKTWSPLAPVRRTRNSPLGEVGQSSTAAFSVTDFGPACRADALFSASD